MFLLFARFPLSALTQISFLSCRQIVWENRLMDDVGNKCKVTVDGVDCLVGGTFIGLYSHKFKKAALRYELGVCIQTGDLVWIRGPFPAGDWNNLAIFLDAIKHYLFPGECVEADDSYKAEDPAIVRAPGAVRFMEDKHWRMKPKQGPKAARDHQPAHQAVQRADGPVSS
jgi:hypothetical protein